MNFIKIFCYDFLFVNKFCDKLGISETSLHLCPVMPGTQPWRTPREKIILTRTGLLRLAVVYESTKNKHKKIKLGRKQATFWMFVNSNIFSGGLLRETGSNN